MHDIGLAPTSQAPKKHEPNRPRCASQPDILHRVYIHDLGFQSTSSPFSLDAPLTQETDTTSCRRPASPLHPTAPSPCLPYARPFPLPSHPNGPPLLPLSAWGTVGWPRGAAHNGAQLTGRAERCRGQVRDLAMREQWRGGATAALPM